MDKVGGGNEVMRCGRVRMRRGCTAEVRQALCSGGEGEVVFGWEGGGVWFGVGRRWFAA